VIRESIHAGQADELAVEPEVAEERDAERWRARELRQGNAREPIDPCETLLHRKPNQIHAETAILHWQTPDGALQRPILGDQASTEDSD